MRVLVTGGAGFIGSALVRYLIQDLKAEVLIVDKLTYAGNLESLASVAQNPLYRFLKADICDPQSMAQAFLEFQPRFVIHLAAESHVDRSITGANDFIQTNIVGSYIVLEAARTYWSGLQDSERSSFRFLHVSTDEVYGSLGPDGLFHETTAYDPSSPYSASKAASDHLAKAWYRTYGLPVIVTNCSNNYGPYHFPEKLIPLSIIQALKGLPISLYGDGSNVRDWLYVEDHIKALWLIANQGQLGETYNIGGGNERSNLEVVQSICDHMDRLAPKAYAHRDLIRFVTDRPGHDHRYAIDATKLEQSLGWQAQFSFDQGIKLCVEWYIANEAWWHPLREARYQGERLGALRT